MTKVYLSQNEYTVIMNVVYEPKERRLDIPHMIIFPLLNDDRVHFLDDNHIDYDVIGVNEHLSEMTYDEVYINFKNKDDALVYQLRWQ